jgi:hypothetical protein
MPNKKIAFLYIYIQQIKLFVFRFSWVLEIKTSTSPTLSLCSTSELYPRLRKSFNLTITSKTIIFSLKEKLTYPVSDSFFLFGVSVIWTQGFMIVRQAFYYLSHSASPTQWFFLSHDDYKF